MVIKVWVPSSPMWYWKNNRRCFCKKNLKRLKIFCLNWITNCQNTYITDKQETNQPIADSHNCPLARRRQVLLLHHRACAGDVENTICILQIYEKANGKGSTEATQRPQASSNEANLRPHKKEQAPFRTSAHSECAAQRNRYAISELRERLRTDILLNSILQINTKLPLILFSEKSQTFA